MEAANPTAMVVLPEEMEVVTETEEEVIHLATIDMVVAEEVEVVILVVVLQEAMALNQVVAMAETQTEMSVTTVVITKVEAVTDGVGELQVGIKKINQVPSTLLMRVNIKSPLDTLNLTDQPREEAQTTLKALQDPILLLRIMIAKTDQAGNFKAILLATMATQSLSRI